MTQALLVLEDGSVFAGRSFGATGETTGEAVFNTGLSGYQEVLTDPSYHAQIVAMTYPHVGNYGVNRADVESSKVRVAGFVVREVVRAHSNHRAELDLDTYLREAGIVGIEGVDTRRLTRHLRNLGAMRGVISTVESDVETLRAKALASPDMTGANLVHAVSTSEPYEARDLVGPATPGERTFRVAAYDYGLKTNILRLLAASGCETTVYPASTPAEEILATKPDGVFLSNGPGDPAAVEVAIKTTRALLGKVPVFGICLGHQILGLALGATTYKLPFGHRGINQPVRRERDGKIEITSHNHGFAVDLGSLTSGSEFGPVVQTHTNTNDNCCEGLAAPEVRAFSVQYHPEAAPGPHDASYLFDDFTHLMATGALR